jgi:1-acyl-sn-glycerol-3-phosphate acyltransferase
MFLVKYLSQLVLYIIGWKPLINTLLPKKRYIMVFSHTSYYDFTIMLLYKFAYPHYFSDLKVLIKPDYFETSIGNYLLTSIGGIRATHIDNRNGGATHRIVEQLQNQDSFKFLISPKGTILKGDWRTGYYHLAKQLNAQFVAVGLDYQFKHIYMGKPILNIYDEPHIKDLLYKDLGNIIPLYPDREIMQLKPHDTTNISVINKTKVIYVLTTMTIVTYTDLKLLYY